MISSWSSSNRGGWTYASAVAAPGSSRRQSGDGWLRSTRQCHYGAPASLRLEVGGHPPDLAPFWPLSSASNRRQTVALTRRSAGASGSHYGHRVSGDRKASAYWSNGHGSGNRASRARALQGATRGYGSSIDANYPAPTRGRNEKRATQICD